MELQLNVPPAFHGVSDQASPVTVANLFFCHGASFRSTETLGLLGTGVQDGHLDFRTASVLWVNRPRPAQPQPETLQCSVSALTGTVINTTYRWGGADSEGREGA